MGRSNVPCDERCSHCQRGKPSHVLGSGLWPGAMGAGRSLFWGRNVVVVGIKPPSTDIKALSVRLGPRPSVLLDNGQRYFEGATLPDGRVLERITERQLVLQDPQGQQTVPVR